MVVSVTPGGSTMGVLPIWERTGGVLLNARARRGDARATLGVGRARANIVIWWRVLTMKKNGS